MTESLKYLTEEFQPVSEAQVEVYLGKQGLCIGKEREVQIIWRVRSNCLVWGSNIHREKVARELK